MKLEIKVISRYMISKLKDAGSTLTNARLQLFAQSVYCNCNVSRYV